MKRLILSALAVSALTLAAPAAALAQHRHHRRHHHAHHARVLTFKATSTPAPTTSSPASTESVGMVSSFEGGVLKITLNDGSVVAGKVTERTEIECGSSGNDEDGSGSSQHGDSMVAHLSDSGSGDDDQGEDENQQGCSTESLTVGAKVAEAELVLTSAGAVWKQVELVPSA